MTELKSLPVPLELHRRYRVTRNAGTRKETTHEGVVSGDYGRFYLMHLDDGTKETLLKNDLYRETTVVEALETVDEIQVLTNEFLEKEKIPPDRSPSEINR